MSADEDMANILHLAHNMEEGLQGTDMPAPGGLAPSIYAFLATRCGSKVAKAIPTVATEADMDCPNIAAVVAVSTT
jgi:hypothetical protein